MGRRICVCFKPHAVALAQQLAAGRELAFGALGAPVQCVGGNRCQLRQQGGIHAPAYGQHRAPQHQIIQMHHAAHMAKIPHFAAGVVGRVNQGPIIACSRHAADHVAGVRAVACEQGLRARQQLRRRALVFLVPDLEQAMDEDTDNPVATATGAFTLER